MRVPLSTDDLGLFFAQHHHQLAAELRGVSLGLTTAIDSRGQHGISQELAQSCDMLRWVTAESGQTDVRALCLIREMLGYVSPLADAVFAASALGAFCLSQVNRDGRWDDLLARYRTGDAVFGFALSEPEAGSDAASLQTRAVASTDGFKLSGVKTLISNAAIATHYVVFATIDREKSHQGITGFVVEATAPGVSVDPIRLNVDHPIGNVSVSDCVVGTDAVLGEVGSGFALAMRVLDTFRPTVGAAAVGIARRAFAEARAHVLDRVQFGKPLAATQLVQSQLADMATDLDAARLLVLRAAHARDHNEGTSTGAAMAKLFATEAAQRIVDRAVQLHGGQGVVVGTVVEQLYRTVRPLRIYEGTSEIQRLIIGRQVVRE